MNFKSFLIKTLMIYFVCSACITVVIGVIGCIFFPEVKYGYEAYFSPLYFAAIGVIPSFVNYSKKELSLRQTIVRKVIHLILTEVIVLLVLNNIGALEKISTSVSLALSIFIVFVTVNIVMWLNDLRSAMEINKLLKKAQSKADNK